MEQLKFAIVGCGHIGKRHLKVINNDRKAILSAICDIDTDKIKTLKKEYPNISTYSNYEEMLQKTDAEVICICTPHSWHSTMSIQAAKANKHILVEKPMALNSSQSREMIEEAQKNGVRLFVVKQNRFNQPILHTTKALRENKLGRIFMVQCNVMWNRNDEYYKQSNWRGKIKTEGGALHTQVSHFLDLLVWWFGDLKDAKTLTSTLNHDIEIEDCGVSSIAFENGIIGSLLWTTCVYNYNYEGSITIIGEKGTIKIGGRYLNEIEFWDVQSYPLPDDSEEVDLPNDYGSYQGSSSNHDKLINELIPQIIQGRKGIVEGDEGMKSISAIEKIYEGIHKI